MGIEVILRDVVDKLNNEYADLTFGSTYFTGNGEIRLTCALKEKPEPKTVRKYRSEQVLVERFPDKYLLEEGHDLAMVILNANNRETDEEFMGGISPSTSVLDHLPGDLNNEEIVTEHIPNPPENDNWKHRSKNMRCSTCMFFVPKESDRIIDLGRCRKRAPTLDGWPAVYATDWCGDHKLDENKILSDTEIGSE